MVRKRKPPVPVEQLAREHQLIDGFTALQLSGCPDENKAPIRYKIPKLGRPSDLQGAMDEWIRRIKNIMEYYRGKDGFPGFSYPQDGDKLVLLLILRHVPCLRFVPAAGRGPGAYWTPEKQVLLANAVDQVIEQKAREGYSGSERYTDEQALALILQTSKQAKQFSGPTTRRSPMTVKTLAKQLSAGRAIRESEKAMAAAALSALTFKS